MKPKPRIALVGAGNLASALAVSLRSAGFRIEGIIARASGKSLHKARGLAIEIGTHVILRRHLLAPKDLGNHSPAPKGPTAQQARLSSNVLWFCVPDSQIANAASGLAGVLDWKGKIALHSSGALSSDALDVLRGRGAVVASVHPLMTFVKSSHPDLAGVPFALEGDPRAVRMARQIVRQLGGHSFSIRKADKPAYHAWGTFASPLLTALLATTESVAALAGVGRKAAARRMIPIVRQTLNNYAQSGAPQAFSGPIVRGDAETVRKHLDVLRKDPIARDVYIALVRASLTHLPVKRKAELMRLLASAR